jgi:TolB protein
MIVSDTERDLVGSKCRSDIITLNINESNKINLTNSNVCDREPRYSPDGSKIVFQTNRDGNKEIYIMNVDGSNQTRLTNNFSLDYQPTFRPIK